MANDKKKVTKIRYVSTAPYYRNGVYYEPGTPFLVPSTEKPGSAWREYTGRQEMMPVEVLEEEDEARPSDQNI